MTADSKTVEITLDDFKPEEAPKPPKKKKGRPKKSTPTTTAKPSQEEWIKKSDLDKYIAEELERRAQKKENEKIAHKIDRFRKMTLIRDEDFIKRLIKMSVQPRMVKAFSDVDATRNPKQVWEKIRLTYDPNETV